MLDKYMNMLFSDCAKLEDSYFTVDAYNHSILLNRCRNNASRIFMEIESRINPSLYNTLVKLLEDKNNVSRLLFIVMMTLSKCYQRGISTFMDTRCVDNTFYAMNILSSKVIQQNVSKMPTWLLDDRLYEELWIPVLTMVHPTLMSNLIFCCIEAMEVKKNEKGFKYMKPFEQLVLSTQNTCTM